MKKFQTMMAVVLVALMAFAVQSCGSDDDGDQYRLDVTLNISEKGSMTPTEEEAMIMSAQQMSQVAEHSSDAAAETATMRVAQALAESIEINKEAFGNSVFTYKFVCTKVSGGKQIVTYYVEYNKGDIRTYNNKN